MRRRAWGHHAPSCVRLLSGPGSRGGREGGGRGRSSGSSTGSPPAGRTKRASGRGSRRRAGPRTPASPRRATRNLLSGPRRRPGRSVQQFRFAGNNRAQLRNSSCGGSAACGGSGLPCCLNSRSWEWGGALSAATGCCSSAASSTPARSGPARQPEDAHPRMRTTARGRRPGSSPATGTATTRPTRARSKRCTHVPLPDVDAPDDPAAAAERQLRLRAGRARRRHAVLRALPVGLRPGRAGDAARSRQDQARPGREGPRGQDVQKLDATMFGGTRIVVYERYSCSFRITSRDHIRVVGAPAPPAP